MKYATHARTSGVLSLEDELPDVTDPFLRKALTLVVDGANPHALREMLETENQSREEYDEIPAKVYEAAGGYAPTVGILGAVLGLIQIMQHLSDPSKLGEGIAVAFVATIYGVGSANLIFLPTSTKLKMKARHESRRRELMLEAVLAIQEGLNPKMIKEKLDSFAAHRPNRSIRPCARRPEVTSTTHEQAAGAHAATEKAARRPAEHPEPRALAGVVRGLHHADVCRVRDAVRDLDGRCAEAALDGGVDAAGLRTESRRARAASSSSASSRADAVEECRPGR